MVSHVDIVVAGATAFPEIAYILDAINAVKPTYRIRSILDDNASLHGTQVDGTPVVGPLSQAAGMPDTTKFVFGIGSHRTHMMRHEVIGKMGVPESRFETIIHPNSYILKQARIGLGCIIHPGVLVGQDAVLEGFNVVFPNSIIASRTRLGKYAMVTSLVSLTDRVEIGPSSFIGTSTVIAEGVKVGACVLVAMGSRVFKDIPDGVFAAGEPLKFIKKISVPPAIVLLHTSNDRLFTLPDSNKTQSLWRT